MSQTLQLEIPDETYRALAERAGREGKTPAELSAEIVQRNLESWRDDPLEEFIGKFNSSPEYRDWADRHDEYIGAGLMKELSGRTEEDDPAR